MPEIIETTVYRLDELSDAARDKARSWYREGGFDYDWYDAVYGDFQRIAGVLGITFKTRAIRLMGGGSRQEPRTWFSGFWLQGDGACFEGYYSYRKNASAAIRAHAPEETKLHGIADPFRPRSGGISTSFAPRQRIAVATTTSIAWRSRSSAKARPGRT
jgi:hypothetical protein